MGLSTWEVRETMPGHDGAYASFVLTHEARLVRSLLSETGLSPASAAAVAAVVLPAAHVRTFASDGAAYGWLRIAARHVASDSADWAEAADAALVSADRAAAALAGLPAPERELLRLRYVDGLLPEALAALLGTPVSDVLARLDHARAAAARTATGRRERRAVSVPRAVGACAAAAAAVALSVGNPLPPSFTPPAQAGPAPWTIDLIRPVTGQEPVPAYSGSDVTPVAPVAEAAPPVAVTPPAPRGDEPDKPGEGRTVEMLVVSVPAGAGEPIKVPFSQPAGEGQVKVCDTIREPPAGVARCDRVRT